MKHVTRLLSLCAATVLLTACGNSTSTKVKKFSNVGDIEVTSIEEMNQVGTITAGSDGELMVADLSKVEAPKALLLSDLVDDLRIIKLDNADDALVRDGSIWVSDKRFIIYDGNEVKQFDRDGKYIGKIGAKGNGPGEYYIAPYDFAIDEKRGKIHMLSYSATKVQTYDLEGKFIGDTPLAHRAQKGFIEIEPDGSLTIAALVFSDDEDGYAVWNQDKDGNVTGAVKAGHLAVEPDFSNEIYKGTNDKGFTYSLFRMDAAADTLYEYVDGQLKPAFTVNFGDGQMHSYLSCPGFYVIKVIGDPVAVSERSFVLPSKTPIIIDKKTGKGGAAELILDFIGPVKTSPDWLFGKNRDYFALNFDPGDLTETLEKAIAEAGDADKESVDNMKKLLESISPDDNNYLIVGKWKK